jgi:glycosyltransferase involved in cell wall biosynthesis
MLDATNTETVFALDAAIDHSAPPFSSGGSVCDVDRELERCVRFASWLEQSPPARFVTAARPRTKEPLISVILPMYNASAWIETAVKSLLLQSENLEIFCVDDASTDDCYDRVAETFGADGRICCIRLARNVGPYQIRNWVASQLARGDLLAFQDADDWSHPNRFSMQKARLGRKDVAACGTSVHQVYQADIQPRRNDTPLEERDGRYHGLSLFSDVPRMDLPCSIPEALQERSPSHFQQCAEGLVPIPSKDSPALYATLMIRKDIFLAFGGFDGHVRIQADRDFTFRLARYHAIANVPAILYSWRIHEASLTRNPETGFSSTVRNALIGAYQKKDEAICAALKDGEADRARQLCVSDLYHGDIEIRDVMAGNAFAGLMSRNRLRSPGFRRVRSGP